MLGRLGFKLGLLGIALALPVLAADRPGSASVSGYVRSAAGVPQMGAMVEVLGTAAHSLQSVHRRERFLLRQRPAAGRLQHQGIFAVIPSRACANASDCGPAAAYWWTSSSAACLRPSRLPAMRGAAASEMMTGSGCCVRRPIVPSCACWKTAPWRQPRNPADSNHDLKGSLSFVAGSASEGFGSASDMSTVFSVEKSVFSTGTWRFRAMSATATVRPMRCCAPLTATRWPTDRSRRWLLPCAAWLRPESIRAPRALQALALSASDEFSFGDILELRFGSELQTIQFMGRVTAFRPFGSADLHLSPNTVLEYRYATSQPDSRMEKGFDSAPADLSESGPHVSLAGFTSTLERAHHHEVSLSHRDGQNQSADRDVFRSRLRILR